MLSPFIPLANPNLSYLGSMNCDFTSPGKVMPVPKHAPITNSGELLHYPVAHAIVTKDTSGNPIVFFAANKTVYAIRNGARATDVTFADSIQDLCMIDNGSGTKLIMAVFGTGSTVNGNATRDMSVDVGGAAWTTNTGATMLTAFFIRRVGPHYYAVTGSASQGRCNLIEWKVAICPFDQTNKHLAESWSTAEPVGDPNWQINGIAAFKDRLCVGKPDGFYVRDLKEKSFLNMTDRIADFSSHGVNGKVTVSGENCVWYGVYEQGKVYRYDGHDLHDETPFREVEKPRDVILGRIEALVDRGDSGFAVLSCWSRFNDGKRSGALGVRVFKEDGGVITEITTNLVDGSLATGAAVGNLGQTTQDYIVVGSPYKLEAVGWRVTRLPNSAVQSLTAPQTLNGSGSWTSLGNIVEHSILGTSGVGFALTGFPASAGQSITGWDGIDAFHLAQTDTYNSISGLYWYRFATATATGYTATTELDEIFTIRARPGLPNSSLLTQSTNFTNRFRAGGMSYVLEFRREGGRIVWYPKYAIHTLGGAFCLALTSGPMAISNSGANLLIIARTSQWVCAEGPSSDPASASDPDLAIGSSTIAMPTLCARNMRLGDPRHLTHLKRVTANGAFLQPNTASSAGDRIGLIVQADEWKQFDFGAKTGIPASWDLDDDRFGEHSETHVWMPIQLDSSLVRPAAPYLSIGVIEHEDDDGEPYEALSRVQMGAFGAPEAV